jgi:hypothetical protein
MLYNNCFPLDKLLYNKVNDVIEKNDKENMQPMNASSICISEKKNMGLCFDLY